MSPSRRRRRLFYRRTFLNRPRHNGLAAVVGSVELVPVEAGGLEIDADLEIADCTRTVCLDFSMWDVTDRAGTANALRKARLLQEVVTDFVAALEEAVEERARENARVQQARAGSVA